MYWGIFGWYADLWDNYRDDPNVLIIYYEELVLVSMELYYHLPRGSLYQNQPSKLCNHSIPPLKPDKFNFKSLPLYYGFTVSLLNKTLWILGESPPWVPFTFF